MYKSIFKRLIDILASLFVLILLSPILIIISLIIKIQDRGPILFTQERVGLNKQPFKILKFRSMPVNTPNVSSDQVNLIKINPFGKFIRRTNIDELPQLFNILKGDMSLIGPRPSLSNQTELIEYRSHNGTYTCRPGLTGLAQVNSYDYMPIAEKARFDGIYAESILFKNDVKIVIKTLSYLTKEPPIY